MSKKILIPVFVLIVIIGALVAGLILKPDAKAQPIPDGVYFSQVKKLSKGQKPACLSDSKAAEAAIGKVKDPKNPIDAFGTANSIRIIDIPAGYTTTTVHSFDGKTATGTNSYTDKNQKAFVGDLKSFNYVAQLNNKTNGWKLTSYIACQQ